jgi:hypothetical protein
MYDKILVQTKIINFEVLGMFEGEEANAECWATLDLYMGLYV